MSEDVEARVRDHYDAGATEKALTVAIEEYGSEVFGFLVSRLRDEDTAGDVFSQTCEDLWRTLGDFGSLHEQGLMEIWNGESYTQLLTSYRTRALCIGCNMRRPVEST